MSSEWQSFLELTESRVDIYSYNYKLKLSNGFSFRMLLDEGHSFLAAVNEHREAIARPLMFIGHSLGCLLLKQVTAPPQHDYLSLTSKALCVANAQKDTYSSFLNSILAIMFLGALHLPSNPTKLIERYILILRSIPNNLSNQEFDRIGQDASVLADTCKLFDDIDLQVEILSLYESEKTRIRIGTRDLKALFNPYRSYALTGPDVSFGGAAHEQHFSLTGSHAELPKFGRGDRTCHGKIKAWLQFVLSNSNMKAVERRMHPGSSPTISLTSMSSYDAARIALKDSDRKVFRVPTGSNEARAGSSIVKEWQILPILNGFATTRRFAKLPCFMIETPVRNQTFFARESILHQLDEFLVQPTQAPTFPSEGVHKRHVVLCGTAGVGKTSIAIEYAFSRRGQFDAIFWIRSDEPSKLEQDFSQIAIELGLQDADEPTNPVICRELAKGWLENPVKMVDQENDILSQTEARWLIVFDNADEPDMLQDYWPLSSNGSILVTSRDPLSKSSPSIASESIDVSPLSDEEAAELLHRLSQRTGDEEFALRIAAQLGGLPLAISQMAAVIRYQYLSFSEFFERYQDESDRRQLHSFDAVAPRPEARGNISSIWAVELVDSQATCILQISAMLDPDCIQERLFTGTINGAAELKDFPSTTFQYSAARAELIKRSLISRNSEKKEFMIHRLLRDSIIFKMDAERLCGVFSFAVDIVLVAWGTTPLVQRHDISLSRSRDGLFPHSLTLKNLFEKSHAEMDRNSSIKLAKLMNEAGWHQHEKGNSEDIKPFLKLALEICQRFPGPVSNQLLTDVHYGLAAAANETDDSSSCLYHTKQLLELRLEAYKATNEYDIRLAIAHNEYGIALVMNRQYKEAIVEFETSIAVYRGLDDYWPSMDTNPQTNMGFTYWIMGQLDRSEEILRDLLAARELKFGVNDRESYRTGRVYHGIGNVCYDRELFEESRTWHQRALAHYQDTLGNVHHKTADLCHRVAQHCLRAGELDHAQTLINQALKVYSLRELVYLPERARTTFLKARMVMQCGDTLEATSLFKQARDMRSQIPNVPTKKDASLTQADFDDLVTFFSR